MLGRLAAAYIGNRIDRSDGRGGLKGAMLGALAASTIRRMGPLGLVLGGAYLAKKAYDGSRRGRSI